MNEDNVVQEIHKFLIDNDWSVYNEDDMYHYKRRVRKNTGVMIVNGQQVQQPDQYIDIEIIKFGLGSIEETIIHGYSIMIDNELVESVYVDSLEDFKKEIYSRFT